MKSETLRLIEQLGMLAPASAQCAIVELPAYQPGKPGATEAIRQYLRRATILLAAVKRVLRHDGTLWLTLPDTPIQRRGGDAYYAGIPWQLALALLRDCWYLRSDMILRGQRFPGFEYFFLLTTSPEYFYAIDAVRVPHREVSIRRAMRGRSGKTKHAGGEYFAEGQAKPHSSTQARQRQGYGNRQVLVEAGKTELNAGGRNRWTVCVDELPGLSTEAVQLALMAGSQPLDRVLVLSPRLQQLRVMTAYFQRDMIFMDTGAGMGATDR